ncbi:hypothetical protein SEA_PIPER2020_46 [Mycobacterium phage Piper2020]|nr:hypothetical protein SEA_MISHA28_44 [Mycobacterium phage Misha28]AVP42483.1 hypothetical protein SEA_TOOTSIEPOP_44 [Mycobacterium phage TootsiePop]QBP31725.1 hypothetical protein SEA_PIPER2020_46 [Mycobacterium phage Piper2020]QKO03229.1 antirepressor [Mycobacterium phage Awesomesauce]
MSDPQNTAVDLTDSAARAKRDALAGRTDVLDKVGVLRCLPDDMHATTTEAATFYEVDVELVRYHLKANRDEFDSDGYRVVNRAEFEREFGSLSNLDPRARSVGLFPRRAVLRLGMLLRDSAVARRVRDYLLDTEQTSPTRQLPQNFAAALRELADEVEAHELTRTERDQALNRVAELAPKAEVAERILDADGDLSVRDAAQSLTRAGIKVGQNRLFRTLESRYGWVSRASDGRYRVKQAAIDAGYMSVIPQSHYHPRTGVLVLDPPQPRVTPKGLQRILADHGSES